ncbi:ladderlectin-like isoform X1 [Anabas testudineus]|uniref:C-type lectin domain-containing protein n=1 Tax=Anabas testudineus TaxID=64144 RepID=A0A3Q1INR7_ANATE|nr:ladderlectin-like isoform X1 [Anabas testudineus]
MKILSVCVLGYTIMVLARTTVGSELTKRFLTCAGGWSKVNDRLFCYVPTPLTWPKAENNCRFMGANLASVHNLKEYNKVQSLVRKITHSFKESWIGGFDLEGEKLFLWSDGGVFNFGEWCQGEPGYRNRYQGCIVINQGDKKCWASHHCYKKYSSICAKKVLA